MYYCILNFMGVSPTHPMKYEYIIFIIIFIQ